MIINIVRAHQIYTLSLQQDLGGHILLENTFC